MTAAHALPEQKLQALVDAGMALTQSLSLDAVLQRMVEIACRLTDAQYGAIGIIGEDGTTLIDFITTGVDDATRAEIGDLPSGKGVLGTVIRDSTPLRLTRIQDHPDSAGFPPGHPPMTTFLGVPVVTRGAVRGRLYLTEKLHGEPFTAEDERITTLLAAQAGIAIENAQLYEQVSDSVSALREANEQLARADRHKRTFLANVSHELRSPLNTMLGYSRLIAEDESGLSDQQREDLGVIETSGRHLLRLITDLLDLSKIEAGKLSLRIEDVDIRAVADDCVASLALTVLPGVELRSEIGELPMIRADHARVRQMLINIMGNAIRFTREGHVSVSARLLDTDAVEIAVRDTGVGIPAADLLHIFDAFFQSEAAESRTPREREGAGLGLAITRNLARMHGGDVGLASTEGVGTIVTVMLPLVAKVATASDGSATGTVMQ